MSDSFILKSIDKSNTQIDLTLPESLVGRSPDCEMMIDNQHLSRTHARFYLKGEHLYLEDLESSNGTFVNSKQISEPVVVVHGDVIKFAFSSFCLMDVSHLNSTVLMGRLSSTDQIQGESAIDEEGLVGSNTVIRQNYPLPAQWGQYAGDQDFEKSNHLKEKARERVKHKFRGESGVTAALMITTGNREGMIYGLYTNRQNWELGRDLKCQIQLTDISISNHHCRVSMHSGHWYAEDLGSSNGVYVNEKRVNKMELQDEDMIRLGAVELVFCLVSV